MLPIHHIEGLLVGLPPDLQDIVLEIRNLISEVAPGVTETIRKNGLSYYYSERGELPNKVRGEGPNKVKGGPVSAGVCGVRLSPDCIRLYFPHGAFIPDPHGLLQGDRLAMRWLHLYAYDQVPWDAVRALIEAHAKFDPRAPR